MGPAVEASTMSADEYLAWEELQEEKHEYYHGEIFAMGGARREHVQVAGNVFAALKQHLRGTPCRAYMSDMKLHIGAMDAFYYPDVLVSCNKNDHQADQFLSFPSLIVEVLSDSTEAYDRGAKFTAYRQIASLKEYVLVDIKTRTVEFFRRTADNDWLLHVYTSEDVCDFVSLDVSIEMTDIFEDIVDEQQ
ncbi:Uma2 family endonuclease [Methyloprofundus sp.]|uniref:Uma2 family endonuclease n=1 Tax=Methyloprofundus sp. TaxID=2020875 RepID=UPI003D10C128